MIEVGESDRDHVSRGSVSVPQQSGSSLGLSSMPGEQAGSPDVVVLVEDDEVTAQLNKDSSDDEHIELYVPPELMNSLLE